MRRCFLLWRTALVVAGALAVAAAAAPVNPVSSQAAAQPANRSTHLVIVVDGLRPDYITPDLMPRLVRLGQRGIVLSAHHSVYPTVTRVNASSMATGAYPETHGLLGNTVYVPGANPLRGLDTGSRENLESIARAEGRLLTSPSLGELLQQAGRKLQAPWLGFTAFSVIAVMLSLLVFIGEAVRDAFDPRKAFA